MSHGIVGHEHVRESVAIEIGESHAHPLADVPRDSRTLRDIRERAVAIVVE